MKVFNKIENLFEYNPVVGLVVGTAGLVVSSALAWFAGYWFGNGVEELVDRIK